MADQRILVRGDNYGDTESLGKLVEAAEGEEFNFIIHTGDITNTYKTDLETSVDQLRGVEPYFETLAERGTLVYIYGNRDKERAFGGSATHISEEYELSVGHRLQAGGELTADGQRFSAEPADAGPENILSSTVSLRHSSNRRQAPIFMTILIAHDNSKQHSIRGTYTTTRGSTALTSPPPSRMMN